MKLVFAILLLMSSVQNTALAKEVHEFMDLQLHATMHIPFKFFGKGFTWLENKEDESKLTYKHTFKNILYADFYRRNSGSRIIVNGALAGEVAGNKERAKRLILEQIEYVDKFAEENWEDFVVARTPEEVRFFVHNTKKTVIVHSIEGARKLLDGPEDAKFWASKGVAFITLIHLLDDEYGHSAITPDGITFLINWIGSVSTMMYPKKKRGLTEKGKKAIKWIADAGMLIDMTHMSPESKDDAFEVMEREGIPPLMTHSHFKPYQNHDRGVTREQLVRTYKMGGLFSLPNSGERLKFHNPSEEVERIVKTTKFCEDSIDNYKLTLSAVMKTLRQNAREILNLPFSVPYSELTSEQKTLLSVGWQSDFNGWVNHGRPRYGKNGCYRFSNEGDYPQIHTRGLAHPGLLPQYWTQLKSEGIDTNSIKRSSEKFLQMWQKVRRRR